MIDETLGPYAVLEKLGEGGMGEVYRAHDARLNRDVALKILPDLFARDPDRLSRVSREAQALAALNHPHIAHLYGLEQLHGSPVLVMEYVEGRTIDDLLRPGRPLPPEEALPLARQIAEGLEAAHDKGIVHRDLKPANVRVTPDGQAKVLDFGLAKAADPLLSAADSTSSPTMARATITTHGTIVGTAAYMSPEQARGRHVDKRTDIWAFGVMLWEMLTGRRLFTGETITDTLAAVVTKEPDWAVLPQTVPPDVRRLLARCLEKDQHRRLRDIGEARLILDDAVAAPRSGAIAVRADARPAPPSFRAWRGVALAASLAALLLLAVLFVRSPAAARPAVMRFDVDAPPGTALWLVEHVALAITPDGGTMAFVVNEGGQPRVYLRRRSDASARLLTEARASTALGGVDLAFSPDGRFLATVNGSQLQRIPVDGGPAVTLATVSAATRGVAWLDNHTIVYSPEPRTGLFAIDADGGTPRALTTVGVDKGERSHRWPVALPGGKAILFTVGALGSPDSYEDASIDALVVATGERRRVLERASFARYAPGGYLIFVRGGSVYAVGFDPQRLTVTGTPVRVLDSVATDPNTGAAHLAVAQDGTFLYVPGHAAASLRRLMWADRTGRTDPIPLDPGVFNDPRISPDGTRVALVVGPLGHGDIWMYDFRQTTLTRWTSDGKSATPIWSADGRSILYAMVDTAARRTTIYRRAADGSGAAERVGSSDRRTFLGSLDANGRVAFGAANDWIGFFDLVRIPLAGKGDPVNVLHQPTNDYAPELSPDGRWLAYVSEESGQREIYVLSVSAGAHWLVSTDGGEEPHWSPDGRTLYYRAGDRLMAVAIGAGSTFTAGRPVMAMQGIYNLQSETGQSYDVDPKTGRFLMIRPALEPAADQKRSARVVLNWTSEVARQLDAGR